MVKLPYLILRVKASENSSEFQRLGSVARRPNYFITTGSRVFRFNVVEMAIKRGNKQRQIM